MKKLLVLSHVLPFPGFSGQQQRVKNTLKGLRNSFEVTFATFGNQSEAARIKTEMKNLCREVIVLPSVYDRSKLSRILHKTFASMKLLAGAMKFSNYVIGELEFAPKRLSPLAEVGDFDCVLFEYWHAYKSVEVFAKKNIPCVLDMHNVLWQARGSHPENNFLLTKKFSEYQLKRYAASEEAAWNAFDGVIAINKDEFNYVKERVTEPVKVFYAPMGLNLDEWNFDWKPDDERPRIAYYGGLDSQHNQQSALDCYCRIMPKVWRDFPAAELWIIGNNPPKSITALAETDSRVVVTGFVEDVKSLLQTMSVVVCPWRGTYGFRSRLVEVMALGIPLVSTSDAVYGMELENEKGILIGANDDSLAEKTLKLLSDKEFSERQSRLARREVEKLYSFGNTYGRLSVELNSWLDSFNTSAVSQTSSRNYFRKSRKSSVEMQK